MTFIKKQLPYLVILIVGVFTFSFYFMPHKTMSAAWDEFSNWSIAVGGASLLLGVISLMRMHFKKIAGPKDPNKFYSWVVIISIFAMALIGFIGGIKAGSLFDDIFKHVFVPLDATMFSLLAFYMASAAFRAFRIRNLHAGILLFSALIVMLAQIPLGEAISRHIPAISHWILNNPSMAAQRAIAIGIGIGSVATALKIILGIEKNVFGGIGG